MKKIISIILINLLFLININNVKAACDAKTQLEINTAASNVTADLYYDEKIVGPDGKVHPEIPDEVLEDLEQGYAKSVFVSINIENITDNIYLTFENVDENVNDIIYAYDAIDGKYQFNVPDTTKIRTYKIKIYSNNVNCFADEIRSIDIKAPMYNFLSGTKICENNNAYYCSAFITTPIDVDAREILEKQYNEEEDEETPDENEAKDNNMLLYIVSRSIVIFIVIIYIIRKIKAKKRDINIMRQSL